ncbi:aminodeoxychorismate synthase component I [Oceanicella actignis]|uniref:Para-aminobenzoate synthetase component 1 n=1 Tax=Oceanicella actignis TaxID=1189325 RepID=A0A1M7STL4_9RHOB|nr:aminodeoxychorismate synthase component I [Oceanicella actignis]TYO90714.1 para-aminobenzoate synthetase component 1 [Oceanicella actignis]SES69783.1 aminodeoxychorismate synthase, subunit I [Oceanicella actignis]SHN61714.1 para-aminobenzoate synthetase component 1 [Oceanicella actignis]
MRRYVLFDNGPEAPPLLFARPRRLLAAWEPAEVADCFARMEAARAQGAWLAGYASYELGYALEPRLGPLTPRGRRAPLMLFGVFDAPAPAEEGAALLAQADPSRAALSAPAPDWSFDDYAPRFARAAAWIRAGEFYQVNLTFPMRARARGAAADLFARMRAVQPVRHGALVSLGVGPEVLSRSPERFFRLFPDGRIEVRPMKGTAPRDPDPEADRAIARWLAEDAKNRAENLMIVDLMRNDLARVAQVGSVRVPRLFHVETYATVHQMVSSVTARLRRRLTLAELFAGLFPCGSITGAPKVRAMEAIRALEHAPRDVYCGAVGWVSPDGGADFNVAIRTLSLHPGGEAVFNVGGGLVQDSTARKEYEECLLKARFATDVARGPA